MNPKGHHPCIAQNEFRHLHLKSRTLYREPCRGHQPYRHCHIVTHPSRAFSAEPRWDHLSVETTHQVESDKKSDFRCVALQCLFLTYNCALIYYSRKHLMFAYSEHTRTHIIFQKLRYLYIAGRSTADVLTPRDNLRPAPASLVTSSCFLLH